MSLDNFLSLSMVQDLFSEGSITPDGERKRLAMKISRNNQDEMGWSHSRWVASRRHRWQRLLPFRPVTYHQARVITEHTGFIAAGC